MKVALICKEDSKDLRDKVASFLEGRNAVVKIFTNPSKEMEDFDIIICIGGDGTILRVLQEIEKCPPIFGINTGKIGLLNNTEPENFKQSLEKILDGKLEVEKFSRLEATLGDRKLISMNEIAILSAIPAKLVGIAVSIENLEVERLRGDGMLFSTSLGSTAYALSSGGPVIDPYLESILVVPIAPFKLGWKPWVLSMDRTIEVELTYGRGLAISDGRKTINFSLGDKMKIKKSENPAIFFKTERIGKILGRIRDIY